VPAVHPELVVLLELSDGVVTVDVEISGTAGDAAPVLDADESVAASFVVEAVIAAGVEVEDTNGGAFSMYEPDGCTA
jgi:hypothetical protein